MIKKLKSLALDTQGQDLIEYALMAGFVAVAAGAIMPGVSMMVNDIFEKIGAVLAGVAPPPPSPTVIREELAMFRIVCAVLAALFLAIIVMRRKNSAE